MNSLYLMEHFAPNQSIDQKTGFKLSRQITSNLDGNILRILNLVGDTIPVGLGLAPPIDCPYFAKTLILHIHHSSIVSVRNTQLYLCMGKGVPFFPVTPARFFLGWLCRWLLISLLLKAHLPILVPRCGSRNQRHWDDRQHRFWGWLAEVR